MRYIIYGAGAVGGTIGGRLFEHGKDVVLIARGRHLDALRQHGLRLIGPDGEATLPIPAVGSPAEIEFGDDDVVIISTKTQDTAMALDALAAVTGPTLPIVCAQNGVENERIALRRFDQVYGIPTMLPATHLEPGVVTSHGRPKSGILDIGRYPSGTDELTTQVAADFNTSNFSARAEPDIMAIKYRKLMRNLGNALDALSGYAAREHWLYARAQEEAERVFAAAGIAFSSAEADAQRRGGVMKSGPVGGKPHKGSSAWQSLARKTGSIEADFLNGEVVLLGRQHGVPTPVNVILQREANRAAREGTPAGSVDVAKLAALVQ